MSVLTRLELANEHMPESISHRKITREGLQTQGIIRLRYMATVIDDKVAFMAAFSAQPCRIRRVSCGSLHSPERATGVM